MAESTNSKKTVPTIRRLLLYGLILMAFFLASAAIFVVMTDETTIAREEAFPEPVILDPERHPSFIFPESTRTYDLDVNRFVDRFVRVCSTGQYSEFRLMLSQKRPPMLPPRFESNFNALKRVQIINIEKLPPISGADVPLYLLHVEYELNDYAVRNNERIKQVRVAIVREDGSLRIGPLPSDAMARLRSYQLAHQANQPSSMPSMEEAVPSPTSRPVLESPPPKPGVSANQPVRVGP